MVTNKRLRCLGENQYLHRVPIQSWHAPTPEHDERECLNCSKPHKTGTEFCSYWCRVDYRAAA